MDFASPIFQKAAGAIRLSRRRECWDSSIGSICNDDRAGTCVEIVECESHDVGFIQTCPCGEASWSGTADRLSV